MDARELERPPAGIPAPPRALVAFLAALLLAALAGLAVRAALFDAIDDHDELWHLATGRVIVETGHVPDRDPFTWTAGDTPWTNTNWLAQVVLFGLYRRGGLELDWLLGLALLFGAVALVAVRARSRVRSPWAAVPPVFLAFHSLWTGSTVRPQGWTFFLLAAALLLVDRLRERVRWGPWLALVLVLGLIGEMHGGFVFVFGAVGLAILGELWRGRHEPEARKLAGWLALALGIGVASFALHPHGFDALVYPLKYARDPRVRQMIAETEELQRPDLFQGAGRFTLVWLASFGALALVGWRALSAVDVLMAVAFGALALEHARGLHYMSVVLAAPWAMVADATFEKVRERGPGVARRLVGALVGLEPAARAFFRGVSVVFLGALLSTIAAYWPYFFPGRPGDMRSPLLDSQRVIAVSADELWHVPGNLFNDMRYGGVVEWALPGKKTFIDGRGDFHGRAGTWAEYARVIQLEPGWDETFARRKIDLALIERSSPLAKALVRARWVEVRLGEGPLGVHAEVRRHLLPFDMPLIEPAREPAELLVRPGSDAAKVFAPAGTSGIGQPR